MSISNADITFEKYYNVSVDVLKWKSFTTTATNIRRHYSDGKIVNIWPCKTDEQQDGIFYQADGTEIFVEWPLKNVTLWIVDRETLFGREIKHPVDILYVEFKEPIDGYCGFLCFSDALDT